MNEQYKKNRDSLINHILIYIAILIGTIVSVLGFEDMVDRYENQKSSTMEGYLHKVALMASEPNFISKYHEDDTFFFSGTLSGVDGDKNKTKIKMSPTQTLTIEISGLEEGFSGELTAFLNPTRTFCMNKDMEKACDDIYSKVEVKEVYAYKSTFNADDIKQLLNHRTYNPTGKYFRNITYMIDGTIEAGGIHFLDKEKTICLSSNTDDELIKYLGLNGKFRLTSLFKKDTYSTDRLEHCSYKAWVEAA